MIQPPQDIADLMSEASRKYGVPIAVIQSVAYHESRYNPEAKSPVGAIGIMQLMPINWQPYGVTDPTDPAQSIDAGTRMLANLYRKYQDWSKALAAYNWGTGNVQRNPDPADWPSSTQKYVSRVLEGAKLHVPFLLAQKGTARGKAT